MPEPASKEKRSKWGLFHSRDNPNSTSTNHTPDSAYGSSEPSISEGTSAATAPSLSESTHGNRNTYDPSVVTTTTTTTTTTTSGGGPQSSTTSQRSTDPSNDRNSYSERDGPPIPIKSSMRDRSPNPQSPQTAPGLAAPGDRSPMTTQGSNYSYPSRTPPPVNPANPPHAARDPPTSTLQGFKSAAAGIHVGFVLPIVSLPSSMSRAHNFLSLRPLVHSIFPNQAY